MKAIDTIYNGYKFRSRLEARWAVFFDELEIKYKYEVEGFDLGDAGWYLPDFWLPEIEAWIEIKPIPKHIGNADEDKKARALRDETGFPVLICGGAPKENLNRFYGYRQSVDGSEVYEGYSTFSGNYLHKPMIIVIDYNDTLTMTNKIGIHQKKIKPIRSMAFSMMDSFPGKRLQELIDMVDEEEVTIFDISTKNTRTCNAAVKARQARFEHGEKPKQKTIAVKAETKVNGNWLADLADRFGDDECKKKYGSNKDKK